MRKLKQTKKARAARRRYRRARGVGVQKYGRKKRKKLHRRRKYGKRPMGPAADPHWRKIWAANLAQRDAEYKKFDAARTAIAKRLGVSSGHAQAHYQALIEHDGMSPEKAADATWGFQP